MIGGPALFYFVFSPPPSFTATGSTYSIAGHPLLSTEAAGLSSSALAAQTLVAEGILGLYGTRYEGDYLSIVKAALAIQVNSQIAMASLPGIASWSQGSRSVSIQGDGTQYASPQALALIRRLPGWYLYGGWAGGVRSLRG